MTKKTSDHPMPSQTPVPTPPPYRSAQRVSRIASTRGLDPRQVRSAEALRSALLRLLERKGFDQITVKEICKEAGVHNATFFRHHPDKDALLDHVAAEEIDRLVAISLPAGHNREGYQALCDYVGEHRVLWSALLIGGAGGAMREELMRVSKAVASTYPGNQSWLPLELSIISTTTLIVETIAWWLSQDVDAYSPKEVAGILDDLVGSVVISERPSAKKAGAKTKG
ncbi:TetR/AcrR family transcriptional regulator [Sphingobium sufflavum]|uniref:TetR/AcrR family transcriptional regulator n=1 Tax=Sphingobium sufflavum TaxID=1129547 RepID=UPI001F1C1E58|nr:TetR/AcrR family transcriptional regulator [Sphingobium sufflavum]MCE7796250.1 TetR/AcrR family transcriptional regulator [Sphingobium sufflavum]